MPRATIRGIYTTALTKLLLKRGYEICFASRAIQERFGIPFNPKPPEVLVEDLPEKDGIEVRGPKDLVLDVLEAVRERIKATCFYKTCLVEANAIYVGKVLEEKNGKKLVDIGEQVVGVVAEGNLKEGELYIFATKGPLWSGSTVPLTTRIKIHGAYHALIKNGWISLSERIKDRQRRQELLQLTSALNLEGWGIKWKYYSAYASLEELIDDVQKTKEKAKEIEEEFKKAEEPKKLQPGFFYVKLLFPLPAKRVFDEIRSTVVSTVRDHHYFKSLGARFSTLVDFSEIMLKHGVPQDLLRRGMLDILFKVSLKPGSRVEIVHQKPDMRKIFLTPGTVTEARPEDGMITLRRTVRGEGLYDGLGVPKESGDYILSTFKLGEWFYESLYFSKSGELKGAYYNVCTPVEFAEGKVKYVDLLIDVVKLPEEEPRVVDADELDKAKEEGLLDGDTYEKSKAVAEQLCDVLKNVKLEKSLFSCYPFSCS